MKLYSIRACDQVMREYANHGGDIVTIEEGCLGYGLTVCVAEGFKTCVIREIPLNCWSSAHSIRFYNSTPKKYQSAIDNLL